MEVIRDGDFIYPGTPYVECVLSGECFGVREALPRAEVVEVDGYLEGLGITSAYRTSRGLVYVYDGEVPFYFSDGRGPDERSVKAVSSFIEEGFTAVRGAAPLHLKYVFMVSDAMYYVEVRENECTLFGAVARGKEVREYVYRKGVDRYSGSFFRELRFFPPDGDVEVKVLGDFADGWAEFLESVRRMKVYSNRGIIVRTFDLPGVVNTVRYPPHAGYGRLAEAVEVSERVGYDHLGPVLEAGSFAGKFVLTSPRVVMYYPVRYSFDGFDEPLSFVFGGLGEEEIVFALFG